MFFLNIYVNVNINTIIPDISSLWDKHWTVVIEKYFPDHPLALVAHRQRSSSSYYTASVEGQNQEGRKDEFPAGARR